MFKRTAEASAVMQASLSRGYLEGPLFVSDLLSMLASGDFRALPKRDVLYNLHIAFSEGCGVAREENMALGMLIASANEENVLAQYDLALYFASLEDDEQYFKWMLRAACQGDEEAQCNIGDCFTSGRGVVEDTQEGLRWYQKSADQGYPYSIFKIALRLLKSVPEEAFQLLSRAAALGSPDAAYTLFECYAHGEGCRENFHESARWYNLAKRLGYEEKTYIHSVDAAKAIANSTLDFVKENILSST